MPEDCGHNHSENYDNFGPETEIILYFSNNSH